MKSTHPTPETEARGNDLANQIPQWKLIRVSKLKTETNAKPICSPYSTHWPVRPSLQFQQKASRPYQPIINQPSVILIGANLNPESENADLSLQTSIKTQFVTRKSLPLAG